MALLDRLAGIDLPEGEGKLPVHAFWAAMVEVALGEITIAQMKTHFNLTGQDATDLDWLAGKYQASANKSRFIELMHVLFILAENKSPGYVTRSDLTARINRIG